MASTDLQRLHGKENLGVVCVCFFLCFFKYCYYVFFVGWEWVGVGIWLLWL